jgi:hypothetical protein
MDAATAVDPWTTACSPERIIFPGALAFTSILVFSESWASNDTPLANCYWYCKGNIRCGDL